MKKWWYKWHHRPSHSLAYGDPALSALRQTQFRLIRFRCIRFAYKLRDLKRSQSEQPFVDCTVLKFWAKGDVNLYRREMGPSIKLYICVTKIMEYVLRSMLRWELRWWLPALGDDDADDNDWVHFFPYKTSTLHRCVCVCVWVNENCRSKRQKKKKKTAKNKCKCHRVHHEKHIKQVDGNRNSSSLERQ